MKSSAMAVRAIRERTKEKPEVFIPLALLPYIARSRLLR